jgi:hypothetical protein
MCRNYVDSYKGTYYHVKTHNFFIKISYTITKIEEFKKYIIGGLLMIKFIDVTKIYDNSTLALKNVNLTMKKRVIAIENGTIIRDEIRGTYDYED